MKKSSKILKIYSIVTQGFLTTLVLIAAGLFIGYKIDKDSPWPVILAVVLGLCGIGSMIQLLLKFKIGGDDK